MARRSQSSLSVEPTKLKLPKQKKKLTKKDMAGYLFSAPLIVGIVGFALYPMIAALIMSFKKSGGLLGKAWVGFQNYSYVLTDKAFWQAIYNTFYMGILSVILGVILSFILASLIYNARPRWRNFFKGIYFLPNVVSLVATSILFTFLFYPSHEGLLNYVLGWFGVKPLGWFSDPSFSRVSIVLMTLWGMLGYNTIIFLAALTSVPRDLYEAAEVDGASWFHKWWYITIPYLRSIIMFMVIIGTINGMKRFTDVWLIGGTAGNPAGTLMTGVLYIYRNGFLANQMGIATAASYILFIIILILTILMMRFNRKSNFD
ncbi:sugar ABC transporter permease [Pullulanibacillus camelliae]|uniref:Sugar ABC transporter permease n=1 Tax=Pullulanibacillus camelliae TaxID=1707096 RepID=A0A8J2YGU4_9BACL|nr:sugar ABC transporter permease [Pullulanibacillus camelliae]GGE38136.1 sugar ABC transporter permease [Pullulanibacillus camelliae]